MGHDLPEEWCWQTLRELRWPVRVICPFCQSAAGRHRRRGSAWHYRCSRCERVFSDLTGTAFESTHLPLRLWFQAMALLMIKGDLTGRGLMRTLDVDLKTARRIQHRLRNLHSDPFIRSIGTAVLCRMI